MFQLAKNRFYILPVAVFIVFMYITYLLYCQYGESYRSSQLTELAKREADLGHEFQENLQLKFAAINRMGQRWEAGFYDRQSWENDALSYYKDYDNFQALGWVDENFYVRWIVPLKGNEKAVNLNLGFEEEDVAGTKGETP